mmetsp:Transcript_13049/g.38361  ORF Transcript_13049/g.38361 Transcript_13049/m.38361 type:complete len:151 (+) Transcript_13049:221-673(+)
MFFLEPEDWSPRFERSFFTVRLNSHAVLASAPTKCVLVGGKTNHPAVYFSLEVLCGRTTQVCSRRYSQFQWLLERVTSTPPSSGVEPEIRRLKMPPKTCFLNNTRDDDFLSSRQEELFRFLSDLLKIQGVTDHPAMVKFLGLDQLNAHSK